MSLHTRTTVSIAGHRFEHFHSLELHQSIYGHHSFRLQTGHGWLQQQSGGLFSASRAFLGQEAAITITPVEAGGDLGCLVFHGIVTAVEAGKAHNGTHGYCVIKGGSPTLLLENGPHIRHFEQQPLAAIVQQLLKDYPGGGMQPGVAPGMQLPLPYIVQYRESDWAFLQRLAARFGEWCFYNGRQLHFGRYTPRKVRLSHPVSLLHFNLELQVAPANQRLQAYEYRKDQLVTAGGAAPPSPDAYTRHAQQVSGLLYRRPTLHLLQEAVQGTARAQLDRIAKLRDKGRLSQLVTLQGQSRQLSLRPGDVVDIQEAPPQQAAYGEFVITALSHYCTGAGDYRNGFSAIPANAAMPCTTPPPAPHCEAQSAVVTDNNDPRGLGRVKVRFRWQQQGASPWIRVLLPHGGADKGFYFIPETGEEVWVDFEGGNPEAPFVLGTVYNGNARTRFGDAQNNIKAIKTRSGHTIRLNDTAGAESIIITDSAGNRITMDTSGKSMHIHAPETLTLSARNISLQAGEHIDVSAAENISLGAGANVSACAGADCTLLARDITQQAQEGFTRSSRRLQEVAQQVSISSVKDNMLLSSSGTVDIKSVEKVKLY